MNDPVASVRTHLRLPFRLSAGRLGARFFEDVRRGRLSGNRCPTCRLVYVPPRPFCARCWQRCEGWLPVEDTGTVTTFVIVNVPFHGQQVRIPYVLAHLLLDGADATVQHLVGVATADGTLAAPEETRIGMRVRAVWRPRERRTGFLSEDVDHFTPTGEPDRDPATLLDAL